MLTVTALALLVLALCIVMLAGKIVQLRSRLMQPLRATGDNAVLLPGSDSKRAPAALFTRWVQ